MTVSYSQDRAGRRSEPRSWPATAAAQDTIKIGVTQPLTGAFAASGNYVAQGAKIAEEEINKAGGVLGKKIQLDRRGQQVQPDRGGRHGREADRAGTRCR